MLKKLTWSCLKRVIGTNFEREYKKTKSLDVQSTLKNLLLHAHKNVPYYHNILTRAAVVKNGKVNLANFGQIPILTKETVRKLATELISKDYKKRRWFFNYSGGSTGEPVKFIQDRLFLKWTEATNKFYYKDIVGVDGTFAKKILLWSARRDIFGRDIEFKNVINNTLTNTIVLNSLDMTETDMRRFVRIINSYKPEIIRGYAGSLFELCRFLLVCVRWTSFGLHARRKTFS